MVEIIGYVNIYNKKATRNEYGWQIVLVVGGLCERLNDSSVSLDSRINDICYIIRNAGIISIEVESVSLTLIGDNSIGLIYAVSNILQSFFFCFFEVVNQIPVFIIIAACLIVNI